MDNINEILEAVEKFDPSILFEKPSEEENNEEEVVDVSNETDGNTEGTTIPAPENIETDVTTGDTEITAIQPPIGTDQQLAELQEKINTVVKQSDNTPVKTVNKNNYLYNVAKELLPIEVENKEEEEEFENFDPSTMFDKAESTKKINNVDIDKNLSELAVGSQLKNTYGSEGTQNKIINLLDSVDKKTTEENKQEILKQTTQLLRKLDDDYIELQNTQDEATANIMTNMQSNNVPVDFANEEEILKFYEKLFQNTLQNDTSIKEIQEVILKENEALLSEKTEELQSKLLVYQSYKFPENYFSGVTQAMTGSSIDHDSFVVSPQQKEQEAALLVANKEYADFVNNLILSDDRFKERLIIIEDSVSNAIDPQIKTALEAQSAQDLVNQKNIARTQRLNADMTADDRFDDLGFGLSAKGLKSFLSGSNSVSPLNPYRIVEKILGYDAMALSDAAYSGLSSISLDKTAQVILMDGLLEKHQTYDSWVMDQADYEKTTVEGKYGPTNPRSKRRLLPEGDQSLVYWDLEKNKIIPFISVYSGDGRPMYKVGLGASTFNLPDDERISKIEKANEWKLMPFSEAKLLMEKDLNERQGLVEEYAIGIMKKEHEEGLFTEEQFTDFLSSLAAGNIGDALRFIPKTVLKQIPYMAANFASYGTYTLFQEGGNLTFTQIEAAAAKDLGIEIGDLTPQQMLDYMDNNEGAVKNMTMAGITGGAGIAAIERAGIGFMIKSLGFAKGSLSQLFRGNVRKALTQGKKLTMSQIKSGLNESATEGIQTGIDQVVTGRFDPLEYVNSMGEGFIGGVVMPLGGAFVSSSINRIKDLSTNTRLSLRDPKFYDKANKVYELARTDLDAKLKAGTITDVEYDNKLNQISADRTALLKIPKHYSVEAKQESFSLFQELVNLRETVNSTDSSMAASEKNRMKVVEARLSEISAEQGLVKQIGQIEGLLDENGVVSMRAFDTTTEADAFIEEQNNSGNWDNNASSDGNGTILTNKETGQQLIIVDKQSSGKVLDIAVADHEFLHALMFQTVKDNPVAAEALGSSLLAYLEKIDTDGLMSDNLKERYKLYKNKPVNEQYEEAMNFLADAFINEEINVNDGILDKLGRMVRNLLGTLGVPVKFNSGKQVYNFVKDYALARKKGKGLNKSQRAMLTESAIVGKDLGKGVTSQIGDIIKNQAGDINIGKQSKRTAQDLMLEYQDLGADMDIGLQEDLVSQYYSLGLTSMGYNKAAGDIQTDEALNFLNSEFPSIARNYNPADGSLSNYMRNTIGPRGKGFFQTEIERKKKQVSQDVLSEKGRDVVDTSAQVDFDAREKQDVGRKKKYASSIPVINQVVTENLGGEIIGGITDGKTTGLAKDIISGMTTSTDPSSVAKNIIANTKDKTVMQQMRSAIGKWGSDTYNDFVDTAINQGLIGVIPVSTIKRRLGRQSNVDAGLINYKKIGKTDQVKVKNGKKTYSRPDVFKITKIDKQKLKEYYKSSEKRQQSLFSMLTEGIMAEGLQTLKNDKAFIDKVRTTLELKRSPLTVDEFFDGLEQQLDQRSKEDTSLDVVTAKASNRSKPVSKVSLNKISKVVTKNPRKILLDAEYTAYPNRGKKETWSENFTDKQKQTRNERTALMLPLFGLDFFSTNTMFMSNRSIFNYQSKKGINEFNEVFTKPLSGEFIKDNPAYVKKYTKTVNGDIFVDKNKIKKEGGSVLNKQDISIIKQAEKEQSTYSNLRPEQRVDLLNDPNFRNLQDEKVKILEKIVKAIDKDIRDSKTKKIIPERLEFWSAWWASQSDGMMRHPVRVLAPIRFFSTSNIPSKSVNNRRNYEAEHTLQVNAVVRIIVDSYINNNVKDGLIFIKDNYIQGQILKTDDTIVSDAGWKSKVPAEFFEMEKPNIWVRYLLTNEDINFNELITYKNGKVMSVAESLGLPLGNLENNPENIQFQNKLLKEILLENKSVKSAQAEFKAAAPTNAKQSKRVKINKKTLFPLINADGTTEASIEAMGNADKAAELARALDTPSKGISVFDFDDTLAYSNSKVIVDMGDGTTRKITPAEFASEAETLEQNGAEFNFDEFNKVVDGKKGPLADLALKRQDKFGSGDIFVLTARPQASAESIKMFLDGIGLNLPIENITGLENGSADAKALWVLDKAAKGYNNFYFADDAIANVQAVKNILDQIDVKSKVQIAKQSKRERINKEFNVIIEQQSGKEWYKNYSDARAKVEGKARNKFEFFIPPSAEDFTGLLYKILPKGAKGNLAQRWIQENLLDPFNKAEQLVIQAKIAVAKDFEELRKTIDNVPKNLSKQVGVGNFTHSQALRVFIWNMQGMDIPGLSQRDKKRLIEAIEKNPDMKVFAEKIAFIQKGKEYPGPTAEWVSGNITSDIINSIQKVYRKEALQDWQENVDIIFSKENMNKLEAIYGSNFTTALSNMLSRMKRGSNRPVGGNAQVENVMDWLNNSVGAVMFLNVKSGLLQLISSVNFMNWSDNNPFKAGLAFANQKQYWKDVMYLLNSDYLVQRRNGLKINVAESEIAEASKKDGIKGVISYLLNKGFIFTRIADSLAISTGGATFYRNRVNSLVKQVNIDTGVLYTKAEAEAIAFNDFYQVSEESQQSSRTDRISMQQASGLGRLVLNFANTPMQYARIIKKSTADLLAGRGDWKTNVSKIFYYGVAQNLIFNAMQAAVFTLLFKEEDDEEKEKRGADEKAMDIGQGMLSSLLRGLGYGGALVDTLIAISLEVNKQAQKKSPDFEEAVWSVFDYSPAIDSKIRKLRSAANTYKYNRKEIFRRGFNLDNPAYLAIGQVVSASTNIPADRALRLMMSLKQMSDNDLELWQRAMLAMGYTSWQAELPYWGTKTTLENEEKEDAKIKLQYKTDALKLKRLGYKRKPMTKGVPEGKLNVDYIRVQRPTGDYEYWLMPKNKK